MLQNEDIESSEAKNGQEGLEMLNQEPDLIILDLEMPVMNGFEFLEKTKEFKLAEKAEIDRGLIEASNEKPTHTYFQIQVTAENKGDEIVRFTGGQLHLYDDSNTRFSPIFVGYGESEISLVDLEPQKAVTLTTQFDIEYDEEMQYRVGIVPNRHGMDGTQEIAFICIKNCS